MPRKDVKEWKNTSIHSKPEHKMEVTGHFHVLVT